MNIQESTLVFKLADNNNFSDVKINSEIKHFIADLRGVRVDVLDKIKNKFIIFDKKISASKGSFVIVSDFLFDKDLVVVPTLKEAYDYIEMEEIERQLDI